ncbi:MAG: Hpt domain-containing protein [Candidatus Aminicenantes bacterium]|jgi:HPt (histidine-containing phosphotransfer) domain-containing protein
MDKNSEHELIDIASALEKTGGDKEFLAELLSMYVEDFEDKYTELEHAVKQKKTDRILQLAHSLKGASANLGLFPLQEAFFRLELSGRKNDTAEAEKILPLLSQEFDRLKVFLEKK